MANLLIINGHGPHPASPGRLNATLVERARAYGERQGAQVNVRTAASEYDVDAEVDAHLWADVIVYQFPLNSFGTPWVLKKYIDEVGTAGMDGRLARGDGRSRKAPKANYGAGGRMGGQAYMASVTLNAPQEAFGDPGEFLLEGASLEDLLLPFHVNARFFGLSPLATFSAFDVQKNPEIASDLARFDDHLDSQLGPVLNPGAADTRPA